MWELEQHLSQRKISLAKTSIGKPASAYISEGVYVNPELFAESHGFNPYETKIYHFEVNPKATAEFTAWANTAWMNVRVMLFSSHGTRSDANEDSWTLAEKLCEQHPAISTYEGVFGGIPHLAGLRISVPDILEQLYLTGSIAAVQNIYAPDVSEDQIKEAIAYAQDFLESAFSS